jgi:hypothetical protein
MWQEKLSLLLFCRTLPLVSISVEEKDENPDVIASASPPRMSAL